MNMKQADVIEMVYKGVSKKAGMLLSGCQDVPGHNNICSLSFIKLFKFAQESERVFHTECIVGRVRQQLPHLLCFSSSCPGLSPTCAPPCPPQ